MTPLHPVFGAEVQFPARCTNPSCRTIFPSGFGASGNVSEIGLVGNSAQCPVCSSQAKVVDGVFNVRDSIVEIISAPESTREILQAFLGIAQQVTEGKISQQEAVEQAGKLGPKFRYLMKLIAGSVGAAALVVSLVALHLQGEANQLTREANQLAREASQSSSEDTKKVLDVLGSVDGRLNKIQTDNNADAARSDHTKAKAQVKAAPVVEKPSRRTQVNHERRKRLKQRREQYGGSRTH
jgi:hypothetical protein